MIPEKDSRQGNCLRMPLCGLIARSVRHAPPTPLPSVHGVTKKLGSDPVFYFKLKTGSDPNFLLGVSEEGGAVALGAS